MPGYILSILSVELLNLACVLALALKVVYNGAMFAIAFAALGLTFGAPGVAVHPGTAQTCPLEFISSGFTAKIGGYIPHALILADVQPDWITEAPSDMTNPEYASFSYLGKHYTFAISRSADGTSKLEFDANGNGKFSDDAAPKWTPAKYAGLSADKPPKQINLTRYMGQAAFSLNVGGKDENASIGVYCFDPNDPGRQALKHELFIYNDFGYKTSVKFGSSDFPVFLGDAGFTGLATTGKEAARTMIGIDRLGNGRISGQAEEYNAATAINLGGTVLKLSSVDLGAGTATFSPSTDQVAEIPMPPDLSVGKDAVAFTAKTTDGKTVHFPQDFKGKIVMLDFWATWCGPCRGEIPFSTAVYAKYHKDGFDILGISLDQADYAAKLAAFTKENKMPWPQVYEGKYWDVSLVKTYGVQGIPFVLLVDGNTGKVIATEEQLRGEALEKTIKANLPKTVAAN